jgi:ribose 5-phosphate isomerase B
MERVRALTKSDIISKGGKQMILAIGSDHAGFKLKEVVKEFLTSEGIEVVDFGTDSLESVDYPDFAILVSEAVSQKKFDFGILICGTGLGMSITANKVKGIRAGLCNDLYTARKSRQHNNANILCMGGRILGEDLAKEIVKVFLSTKYEGGRHDGRVKKISKYESSSNCD